MFLTSYFSNLSNISINLIKCEYLRHFLTHIFADDDPRLNWPGYGIGRDDNPKNVKRCRVYV